MVRLLVVVYGCVVGHGRWRSARNECIWTCLELAKVSTSKTGVFNFQFGGEKWCNKFYQVYVNFSDLFVIFGYFIQITFEFIPFIVYSSDLTTEERRSTC